MCKCIQIFYTNIGKHRRASMFWVWFGQRLYVCDICDDRCQKCLNTCSYVHIVHNLHFILNDLQSTCANKVQRCVNTRSKQYAICIYVYSIESLWIVFMRSKSCIKSIFSWWIYLYHSRLCLRAHQLIPMTLVIWEKSIHLTVALPLINWASFAISNIQLLQLWIVRFPINFDIDYFHFITQLYLKVNQSPMWITDGSIKMDIFQQ